jgi:hypothetical protein
MNICVVGWYWDKDFYSVVSGAKKKHSIIVVAHREPTIKKIPVSYVVIPNIGLEFGCYSHYLTDIWTGGDTFFLHDDTRIAGSKVFDKISETKFDCAYVFRDRFEEEANGGKHGRAIFCSDKFLEYLKSNGGFWYDKENFGYTGHKGQKRPNRKDGSPINFNVGIHTFHKTLGKIRNKKIGLNVVNKIYFQEFEAGRRGTWRHKDREWERYGRFKNT